MLYEIISAVVVHAEFIQGTGLKIIVRYPQDDYWSLGRRIRSLVLVSDKVKVRWDSVGTKSAHGRGWKATILMDVSGRGAHTIGRQILLDFIFIDRLPILVEYHGICTLSRPFIRPERCVQRPRCRLLARRRRVSGGFDGLGPRYTLECGLGNSEYHVAFFACQEVREGWLRGVYGWRNDDDLGCQWR